MKQLNVLLVSYSFPPAGGVGVLRAASLARYLPASNIRVDVLTTRNASAVGTDSALLKDLSPDVTIHRTTTLDIPFALKKAIKKRIVGTGSAGAANSTESTNTATRQRPNLLKRIIQDLLLPDPQVTWLPILRRAAKRIVKSRNIDVVLITVPPFSSVLLVSKLRKQFPGLCIVVDFRDEWLSTTIDLVSFSRSDRARRIARESEADAVRNANTVVMVTEAARQEIKSRYPQEAAEKFQLVPNGYDASTLSLSPPASNDKREKITITYVGTIYRSTDPMPLVESLHSLPETVKARLQLVFIGHIEEPRFREALLGLGSMVEMKGFVPQKEALAALSRSDYALLITHDALNVSAKLYDYVGSRKPILAVLNPDGDCRRLIEEFRAGWWAGSSDIPGIRQLFTGAIERAETLATDFQPNNDLIDQYERKVLAARYAALLHSAACASAPSTPEAA